MPPSDPIARLTAALEDRYRVVRPLGEGGMATVYLAEDVKHDRNVAIKVLKPELSAVIGAERFVAEIKTTAQLQHPHILPLFDSGEADGFLYYVMPYVEGESLRDKLDQEKQLGVEEAVGITRNVADALHYAHGQGVIHRDVKPANILLHDGRPVVADFGIAVAISAAGGGRLTETGLSLGTPHYMSPEQATADRDVSARSDVYSLGCVLYEMLTGEPPHTASTAQAVLVRILTEAPRPATAVRASVPPHVSAALQKALEKLPADRFRSAEDFRNALDDPSFRWAPRARAEGAASARSEAEVDERPWLSDVRSKAAVVVAAVAAVVGLLLGQGLARTGTETASTAVHRYTIADTARQGLLIDISSRGDVAYVASVDGQPNLRLRRASDTAAVELPGTTGGGFPVFSPSGDWMAFSVDLSELKKIQLATGTVVTLVPRGELTTILPSDWTADGDILFAAESGDLFRVPASGGTPERILEGRSLFAEMLPDGRTLVYTAGTARQGAVAMLDLETGEVDTLVATGSNPQWSPTGHLLYGHPSGAVFALPFDLERREPTGPAVPVRESVFTMGGLSAFEISPTGSLLYLTGGRGGLGIGRSEIGWMDTSGEFTMLPIDPTEHADIRLSPEGGDVAYVLDDQIYLFDIDLGTNLRFTYEGADHHDPVWSPDGSRIAFSSDRQSDGRGIWVKDTDGRSPAQHLVDTDEPMSAWEWLDDGTIVLTRGLGDGSDILITHEDSAGSEPTPLLEADWQETRPAVSPDGTLMAYVTTEGGTEPHVFVREFPSMAGRWQISDAPVLTGGFAGVLWANDGSALYYQESQSASVIRAEIEREQTLRVVDRSELSGRPAVVILEDFHPEGERFLVSRPVAVSESVQSQLVVAVNWIEELKERLGGGS